MNYAFRIGSLLGVTIRVHVVFVLLVTAIVVQTAVAMNTAFALAVAARLLLLFMFVALHELGHSLAAQAHGIRVHDIVLWPLGGMARLERLPENPAIEFKIAIAGPAVNFFLVLLFLPLHLAVGGSLSLDSVELLAGSLLGYAVMVNLTMGTFNLVPAFPLDGGRVLRAALARRVTYLRATRVAVWIGRALALGLAAFAFVDSESASVLFIAAFVWWIGGQELRTAELRAAIGRSRDDLDATIAPGARRFLALGSPDSGARTASRFVTRLERDASGDGG